MFVASLGPLLCAAAPIGYCLIFSLQNVLRLFDSAFERFLPLHLRSVPQSGRGAQQPLTIGTMMWHTALLGLFARLLHLDHTMQLGSRVAQALTKQLHDQQRQQQDQQMAGVIVAPQLSLPLPLVGSAPASVLP